VLNNTFTKGLTQSYLAKFFAFYNVWKERISEQILF
jgi:hypothetical protein